MRSNARSVSCKHRPQQATCHRPQPTVAYFMLININRELVPPHHTAAVCLYPATQDTPQQNGASGSCYVNTSPLPPLQHEAEGIVVTENILISYNIRKYVYISRYSEVYRRYNNRVHFVVVSLR